LLNIRYAQALRGSGGASGTKRLKTRDLKRTITILLLLVMIVQLAGPYYHDGTSQCHSVKDIDGKVEEGSKEDKKQGEAIVAGFPLSQLVMLNSSQSPISRVVIISSPVPGHIAPPPDCASRS
jgi:hypothetical protein